MTRKEFVKMCGILGVGLPLPLTMGACSDDAVEPTKFDGKVVIIGAGAGGLSAGYLLSQLGIDFEILEASQLYGGRMRINTFFTDFPIPLGSEWIETDVSIFQEIVNDEAIAVDVETVADDPDRKFVGSSWFGFFEEFIVPSVADKISYNALVQSIDYTDDQIIITTQSNQYTADKVIVSVPLKILQDGDINFTPTLAQSKLDAINEPVIWDGFKAFIEFSDNFYNDGMEFNIDPITDGEKVYYNGSHGQNTTKNILALFVVGKPAQDYISRFGDALRDFILAELDLLFDNQATPNYIKHITQNWNDEPFIRAGYMSDHADWRTVRVLGQSVSVKIYFAGGAYTDGEDWVSVHTAAQSAKVAVNEIVK